MRGKVSSSQMTYFEGGITPAHAGKSADPATVVTAAGITPAHAGKSRTVTC